MKKSLFVIVLFAILLSTVSVFAEDGSFTCDSNIEDFNGKTFDNLTINVDGCKNLTLPSLYYQSHEFVLFENVTVTGEVNFSDGEDGYSNDYINFVDSTLNKVNFVCAKNTHTCQFGINEGTSVQELNIYPSGVDKGNVVIRGMINEYIDEYKTGTITRKDGFTIAKDAFTGAKIMEQPEIAAEVYKGIATIQRINYYYDKPTSLSLVDVWVMELFTHIADGIETTVAPTVNMKTHSAINFLNSDGNINLLTPGFDFINDYQDTPYIFMLQLHSDSDVTVTTGQIVFFQVTFFGNGADKSTLYLKSAERGTWYSEYQFVFVYGANVDLTYGGIVNLYLNEKRTDFTYDTSFTYYDDYKDRTIKYWENKNSTDEFMTIVKRIISKNVANFAFIEFGGAEEGHGIENNIPYILLNTADIWYTYFSENYVADPSNLPKYITDLGWNYSNFSKGSQPGTYGMAVSGDCTFHMKKIYRIGTDPKDSTLLESFTNEE